MGPTCGFCPGAAATPWIRERTYAATRPTRPLPVLTGGAYLHLGHGLLRPEPAAVRGAMCLFGSTSPSYLIMQSLDLCTGALAGPWSGELAACVEAVDGLKAPSGPAGPRSGTPRRAPSNWCWMPTPWAAAAGLWRIFSAPIKWNANTPTGSMWC